MYNEMDSLRKFLLLARDTYETMATLPITVFVIGMVIEVVIILIFRGKTREVILGIIKSIKALVYISIFYTIVSLTVEVVDRFAHTRAIFRTSNF